MARVAPLRKVAVEACVLVVVLVWAGFFTWGGSFLQILSSWIGEVPGARLVHFLWMLNQIAWWQVVAFFSAILIGCCSNWLEAVPEWRRLHWAEVEQPGAVLRSGPTSGA
jgi:thiosulfate reductase cytochrome b subunit